MNDTDMLSSDVAVHPHKVYFNLPDYVDSISDICIVASDEFLSKYELVDFNYNRFTKALKGDFIHYFDGNISFYSPSKKNRYDPFDEGFADVLEFCNKVIKRVYANEFIKYKNDISFSVDNHPLRINVSKSIAGDLISIRVHPENPPMLEQLSLPWGMYEMIMHDSRSRGGLIIIAAENGQGKSTTLGAILNSILCYHGGLGVTIEDPVELNLHGWIGENGRCIQTEISNVRTIEEAASDAARQFPTSGGGILLIGEIRDPQTAALAMKFANRGILVLTTIHANTPRGMVASLLNNIAEAPGQNITLARESLANSLRFLICQSLDEPHHQYTPKGIWDKRIINGEMLFNSHGNKNIKLVNAINHETLKGLNDIISNQKQRLNVCKNNYTKGMAKTTHEAIESISHSDVHFREKIFNEFFLMTR